MKTYRYKLIVEYIGTEFVGWQRQKDGISVQTVIENAILSLTKQNVNIFASGRTDAGVHALGQVVHFDLPYYHEPYQLLRGLNHFIRPHAVAIIHSSLVDEDFHARFSAQERHYLYQVINKNSYSIIEYKRMWWIKEEINVEAMLTASLYLIGEHDFTSYRATACQSLSPIKTINNIQIITTKPRFTEHRIIEFYFSAKSFLHHMVRNLVGSLIMVGLGKWHPLQIQQVLEARDRRLAAATAPAHGLYFLRTDY